VHVLGADAAAEAQHLPSPWRRPTRYGHRRGQPGKSALAALLQVFPLLRDQPLISLTEKSLVATARCCCASAPMRLRHPRA
jgi:hypothetical protein